MIDQTLSAELRNARALRGVNPAILVDFVLKNHSKQSIELVRRWNSWGAQQWRIEVMDARGTKYVVTNPIQMWARNFFQTFVIPQARES
jgi:hypothetical protein